MGERYRKNGDIRPVNKKDIPEKPQGRIASTPLCRLGLIPIYFVLSTAKMCSNNISEFYTEFYLAGHYTRIGVISRSQASHSHVICPDATST